MKVALSAAAMTKSKNDASPCRRLALALRGWLARAPFALKQEQLLVVPLLWRKLSTKSVMWLAGGLVSHSGWITPEIAAYSVQNTVDETGSYVFSSNVRSWLVMGTYVSSVSALLFIVRNVRGRVKHHQPR